MKMVMVAPIAKPSDTRAIARTITGTRSLRLPTTNDQASKSAFESRVDEQRRIRRTPHSVSVEGLTDKRHDSDHHCRFVSVSRERKRRTKKVDLLGSTCEALSTCQLSPIGVNDEEDTHTKRPRTDDQMLDVSKIRNALYGPKPTILSERVSVGSEESGPYPIPDCPSMSITTT